MAEYDGDEESSFWPWVTGIVLLAMVIWVAAELSETEPEPDEPVVAVSQTRRNAVMPRVVPDSVVAPSEFRTWVRDSSAVMERAAVETYARAGLLRLISALREVIRRTDQSALHQRVATLREQVMADSTATANVEDLRTAMMEADSILAELHRQAGARDTTEQNLAGARAAASELEADVPLDGQRHRVYRYFDFMAESLTEADVSADSAAARDP